jgi:hypothetical protein
MKGKYVKLFIKFLKKENLINDVELYHYFLEHIKPSKLLLLPYAWLNCKRGCELNINDKYWDFIEEIFVEDIMRMFYLNPYTRGMDGTKLRNRIKKEMRSYGVMPFCCYMLHEDMNIFLTEFYNL